MADTGHRTAGTAGNNRVVVVGAGPVGLAAGLALRARGLPVAVLEADPENRVRPGSRALYVHRRSLELLERAHPGLGSRIAEHGTVWNARRTLYRGRPVFEREYPQWTGESGLPPFTSLRQVDTEQFLLTACHEAGVAFHWNAEVREVNVSPDLVTLTSADGRRWHTPYVVAADGARSSVRRALGIPLAGARSRGFHVVVDIADAPDESPSPERVFHYEHPGVGGRTVLTVPFAGGFQVDLQCHERDDPDGYGSRATVRRWLPAVAGNVPDDRILWVSTYHFLQLVATDFTDPHRRVLLAGEAAHLFPPFGARGMNSGFADAEAAAQAIATALAAPDRPALPIDEFAAARHDAALLNSAAAGAALRHLRPTDPITRFRQRTAAAFSHVVPRFGEWLDRAPYGPRHGPPTRVKASY